LPIEVRSAHRFLFGLKHQLCEWGFEKPDVRVDTDSFPDRFSMTVKGLIAITMHTSPGHLRFEWHSAWSSWADLHNSAEVKELIRLANANLTGKGVSKGKTGPPGQGNGLR
jgi:hypothetical protein